MTTSVPRGKIIVNPAAGANSTHRKWQHISRLLKHIGLSFDHEYTEGTGHAIELARNAAGDGYQYVVAVGGDGTVNEVANGLLHFTDNGRMALGVISTGTGSDFVRSVGIPRNYTDACSCLTGSRRASIDAGVIEYVSNGQSVQRFFVNAAGIGFDAAAAKTTEHLPKRFGGTVPYLAGLLNTMIGYKNKSVEVRIGDRVGTTRILSVVVSNGKYFGGGMRVAPEARLDDGLLEVIVIGDIGKLDLLKSLPMIYKGTHGNHPKVSITRAEKVTVKSAERLLVQADGEVLGEGPVSFWLKPAALSIMV